MRRFFVDHIEEECCLWLNAEESRHAVKVLRFSEGDKLLVFDSSGKEYEAEISSISSDSKVQVRILKEVQKKPENILLSVAQGFLHKQKMDELVEKACEIGLHELIPVMTEFSAYQLKQSAYSKVLERWKRILTAARKQSGNIRPFSLGELSSLEKVLEQTAEFDYSFAFHPDRDALVLKEVVQKILQKQAGSVSPVKILLLIGPEGGFSESEIQSMKAANVSIVQLGSSILRAETAFVALSSIFKLLV